MHSTPAPEPDHLLLHNKLKESFGPIYLTVLSVIQGVALADLASVVQASYQEFTFVHWLLTATNFVMFIIIWNAYTIQGRHMDLDPDLQDAIIPFVFGALELFLNHAITLTLTAWLTALTLLSGVGCSQICTAYGARRRNPKTPECCACSDDCHFASRCFTCLA
jgi:hypothetical protein